MKKSLLFLLLTIIISCQSKKEEKKSLVVAKPLNEVQIEKNNDSLFYKLDKNTIVINDDTLHLESPFIYSFEGKINGNKNIQLHLSNQLSSEYGGYSKTATIYIEGENDILYCYFDKDKKQDYYIANIYDNDSDKIIGKLKLHNLSTEEMYIEYTLDKKNYKIYPSTTFPVYRCYDKIDYTLFDSSEALKNDESMRKFTPSRDYNFFAEIVSNDGAFNNLETKLKYLNSDSLSIKNYKNWKHNFSLEKSKNEEENFGSENLNVSSPVFIDATIYVVSNFSYSYMGGAHGMMRTAYDNYDVATGKNITIEQIINTADKDFIAFYENRINSDYGDGVLGNEIPMTDNFYILPTGITFSYAPYELLGFAAGEPHVFFSYEELKPYILKSTILDKYNTN
jgi:hypothetical protein